MYELNNYTEAEKPRSRAKLGGFPKPNSPGKERCLG
jgi:hypothetical protein